MVAMLCDHANKYTLNRAYPYLEDVGRLAFPIFAYVVAANLSWNTGDRRRYFSRLVVWGLATEVVFTWATGRTELNILLTLAIGVQLVLAVKNLRAAPSAAALLWIIALFVASLATEYRPTGALLVLVFTAFLAAPTLDAVLLIVLAVAALNESPRFAPSALAALLVIVLAACWQPGLPRLTRHWFYPFYPLHLVILRLAKA